MKLLNQTCISIFFMVSALSATAGTTTSSRFINPLDLPLYLAAGFGEVRPGHFHAGLDIRTNQKEGYQVKAISDGYVSRVAVNTSGYGNVVYVTHTGNTYISVYAHLQKFFPALAAYVHEEQYKRKSFTVDLNVPPGRFRIKQGEILGISGNSGSSGGPHLHFELRDQKRPYMALNPLRLGYDPADRIPPVIKSVYVYPLEETASIDGRNQKEKVEVEAVNKNTFKAKMPRKVNVKGKVGFGIECYDLPNKGSLQTNPYSIELRVDDEVVFYVDFAEASYNTQRMASAYLDYELYNKYKTTVHKSFISKCNTLANYKHTINKGAVVFKDNARHKISYTVKDFFNNTANLQFYVFSDMQLAAARPARPRDAKLLRCNEPHSFVTKDIKLFFPKDSFFDDFYFEYAEKAAKQTKYKAYSALHYVHNGNTALNKNYSLYIKPNQKLGDATKAVIVSEQGGCIGGRYEKGWVKASAGQFGTFYITEDTVKPSITKSTINTRGERDPKTISFKIADNLSGIKSFNGYINDKWVLFEYEPKRGIISYYYDDHFPVNDRDKVLKLIVSDNVGNEAIYREILRDSQKNGADKKITK